MFINVYILFVFLCRVTVRDMASIVRCSAYWSSQSLSSISWHPAEDYRCGDQRNPVLTYLHLYPLPLSLGKDFMLLYVTLPSVH